MKYKNKYFREVLEKDLKEQELGINIHCKEDGIYVTVPPYPLTGDSFTDEYGQELLKENYNTEDLLSKIKNLITPYKINIKEVKTLYGENIKIKLRIDELHNN